MRTSLFGIFVLLSLFECIVSRRPYLYNRGLLNLPIRSRDGINSRIATTISSTVGGGSGLNSSSSTNDNNDETTASTDLSVNTTTTTDDDDSTANAVMEEETSMKVLSDVSDDPNDEITTPVEELTLDESNSTTEPATTTSGVVEVEEDESSSTTTVPDVITPPVVKAETNLSKRAIKRQKKKEERSHRRIAKQLKNRNHVNISRKITHAGFGLFFATMNHILPKSKFVPAMAGVTSLSLLVELLRYRKSFGWMNEVLHWFLGSSLRKHEMEGKFTGSFYYFLGVTLTSACFPQTCASLGICQLALADPSASYFGRQTRHIYWSRIENGFFGIGRNKGFLGFLGGAIFCFPFNYRVLSVAKFGASGIPGGRQSVAIASIALGIAGSFADLCVPTPALTMPKKIFGVPMPALHVDDNIVVPVFSGYACTKIFKKLGWSSSVDLAKYIIF